MFNLLLLAVIQQDVYTRLEQKAILNGEQPRKAKGT